ncbi:ATP-binding cassette domain-containing protein [Haloimpatiens massiliensis]|uniref:ATP-binding cassette domain-containing protein n=1 Tax=Haloimpatiens massiliensis TaxID=1658110 RepID=UPI000C863BB8|nr:ATP-binding cassette domain-containing protein [Haloimpatiens massiliensis]
MNIELINGVKEYSGRKVLDAEHIVFEEGHIYAVLGLNGSGKSTLLQCIAGFNELTQGKILYDDGEFNEKKKEISMMSQQPFLFNSSVKENVIMGLKFRKISKEIINKRFENYSKYFEIDEILNKNAKKLSGGESAKVSLLRTAILETEVVILDEPTASMDIESTMAAEKLIKDIMDNKKIIIIVTHDLYQAERIADYVIFMDKGKVIEQGEKNVVFNTPTNSKVKLILNK